MIRAIIFDFDGTILDTELPEYECWQEIYSEHGCELSLEAWSKCLGTTYEHWNPFDHLEQLSGGSIDREHIEQERRRRFRVRLEGQAIVAGVLDYLDAARELGLSLGVASSSTREWVTRHLTHYDLIDYFEVICCRDDGYRTKPHPDLYSAVLEKLGVAPAEAIAIEDSPNGAYAAKAAGLYTVAVPNAISRTLPLDHADLRVQSLTEISLPALIARCERDGCCPPTPSLGL